VTCLLICSYVLYVTYCIAGNTDASVICEIKITYLSALTVNALLSCTALVWFGSHRREWKGSVSLSVYLARKLQFLSLFLHLVFFNEPEQKHRETAGTRSALCLFMFIGL